MTTKLNRNWTEIVTGKLNCIVNCDRTSITTSHLIELWQNTGYNIKLLLHATNLAKTYYMSLITYVTPYNRTSKVTPIELKQWQLNLTTLTSTLQQWHLNSNKGFCDQHDDQKARQNQPYNQNFDLLLQVIRLICWTIFHLQLIKILQKRVNHLLWIFLYLLIIPIKKRTHFPSL